MSKIWYQSDVK